MKNYPLGSTINYLAQELRETADVLRGSTGKYKLSVVSASDQFIRFATLNLASFESEVYATILSPMLGFLMK